MKYWPIFWTNTGPIVESILFFFFLNDRILKHIAKIITISQLKVIFNNLKRDVTNVKNVKKKKIITTPLNP